MSNIVQLCKKKKLVNRVVDDILQEVGFSYKDHVDVFSAGAFDENDETVSKISFDRADLLTAVVLSWTQSDYSMKRKRKVFIFYC